MLLSVDRSDPVQLCAGFTLVQEARGDQGSEATARAIRTEWIGIHLQNGDKLASLPTSFTTLSISTFGSSPVRWAKVDGRQNHLRDVAGAPVSCPQSRERMVHHHFIAVLAGQVRSRSWEIVQVDPPCKASRYFR